MAGQKLTVKEKQIFRQGCCCGYKKAIKDLRQVYDKGREDAIFDFLNAQVEFDNDKTALHKMFKNKKG